MLDGWNSVALLPGSVPSSSRIVTSDCALPVVSSMVFHVPTGVSLAAQAAPAAMATSTVAAYSSGRIAVFMGSLQNGLIIIDGTASRACAESVLNHHRARFAGLTADRKSTRLNSSH